MARRGMIAATRHSIHKIPRCGKRWLETLTAGDIGASTVWVAVTFDEIGGYDPFAGPPPSGTPLAIYSADQTGMPSGLQLPADQETKITIAFDDTIRLP